MTRQEEHNRVWLRTAMLEPIISVGRSCYYDHKHNHFFSLSPMHFLMFEDAVGTLDSSYHKSEAVLLKDKIERLRIGDQSILPVTRLTVNAKIALQAKFVAQVRGMYYYEQMQQAITQQDENTTTVLDQLLKAHFGLEPMLTGWQSYRNRLMDDLLTNFAAKYNIGLAQASIWHVNSKPVEVRIKAPALTAKRWWKWW